MNSQSQVQTVVADTSSLVSLAVPQADTGSDRTAELDPLNHLLTACTVSVPPEVVSELNDIAQYQDVHGRAAAHVLAARNHYTVTDPYSLSETPDTRPTFGLDDGETDGIVLANVLDADGFLTDEFGGSNFALIHAALTVSRLVPAPRFICDHARNGHITRAEARKLITAISPHRSWENNSYVSQILDRL